MTSALGHTLSHWHVVIAWTIFLASYLVFAIGRLPGTKIDRPAMAIIGAVLMFVFGVLSPKAAIESIDFTTLVLLFSMMLIVASLHLAGFFEWITRLAIEHLSPETTLAGHHLHQRNSVGIPGQRHRLPHARAPDPGAVQAHAVASAALSAGPGDSFQHRQHGDHHRQSAEHSDRLHLRHSVSHVPGASWSGRASGTLR